MAAAIELQDVSKRYRIYRRRYDSLKEMFVHRSRGEWEDRWALRGVSLEVQEGRTLGLIGANGSGKSTALKVMGRILVPDRGRVSVRGRVASLIELGAGFQPDYTGRENLYLNASLLGLSKREVDRRFDDIVEFAELQDHIDDPIRTYSSGMYMRLGFSIAIHVDPEVLLIDEILAVGDESFQHRCIDWLDGFKASGGTIVVVSHNLGSIRQLCERTAWIEEGRVRGFDRSAKVVDDYLDQVRGREEELRSLGEARRAGKLPDVELGTARILDRGGLPVDEIRRGDGVIVEIPYSVHRSVKTPAFGVALHSNDGVFVHRTTTVIQGLRLPPLRRGGVVRLRYPALNLNGGVYRLTTAIYDSLHDDAVPIDQHDMRYKLLIEDSGYVEGLVNLANSWEIDPALLPAIAERG